MATQVQTNKQSVKVVVKLDARPKRRRVRRARKGKSMSKTAPQPYEQTRSTTEPSLMMNPNMIDSNRMLLEAKGIQPSESIDNANKMKGFSEMSTFFDKLQRYKDEREKQFSPPEDLKGIGKVKEEMRSPDIPESKGIKKEPPTPSRFRDVEAGAGGLSPALRPSGLKTRPTPVAEQEPEVPAPGKTKRGRRTKAQMEEAYAAGEKPRQRTRGGTKIVENLEEAFDAGRVESERGSGVAASPFNEVKY